MALVGTLTGMLKLDNTNFKAKLTQAKASVSEFSAGVQSKLLEPAKAAKVQYKDVARIVQGIVVSRIFYSSLQSITAAADAVWEFSKSLEYAQIAYANLFGDTALAEEFINVLKDFSAVTPFSFSDSEAAAKRLLAYGIQSENVMYIMQGILAASSMQGSSQVIESVSRALGQIYTKGKVMNEELRQLAESGIPVYEILQEKLGLTNDQIARIGDQAIPAAEAINALVEGMNERFGGVIAASSYTMQGLISNIKDNAEMLGAALFEPLTSRMKLVFIGLEKRLTKLRDIADTQGIGGVFEEIVPKKAQVAIKIFIADIQIAFATIKALASQVKGVFGGIFSGFISAINLVLPALSLVFGLLGAVAVAISKNSTAMRMLSSYIFAATIMWVAFRVQAMASAAITSVITTITGALKTLQEALIVSKILFASLLAVAAVAVGIGIFAFTKKGGAAIDKLQDKLTKISGIDTSKSMLPETKERNSDLSKFNKELSTTSDEMDDVADSTGSAAAAAKSLLSFDEAFKLDDPDEGTGSGSGIDNGGDIEIPNVDAGGATFFPDLPNISEVVSTYAAKFKKKFGEAFAEMGLGALVGSLIGYGLLGVPGALIGAALGALAGYIWKTLADKMGMTDIGAYAVEFGLGIGAAIGFLVGGPGGAAIGAAIGVVVGFIVDAFAKGFEDNDWSLVNVAVGAAMGGIIGFAFGGPVGAAIGVAVGGLIEIGWNALVKAWPKITGFFDDIPGWLDENYHEQLVVVGKKAEEIRTKVEEKYEEISKTIHDKMGTAKEAVSTAWDFMQLSTQDKVKVIKAVVDEKFDGLATKIDTKVSEAATSVKTKFEEIKTDVRTKVDEAATKVRTKFGEIKTDIYTKSGEARTAVVTKFGEIKTNIATNVTSAYGTVKTKFEGIKTTVAEKASSAWNSTKTNFDLMKTKVSTRAGEMWTSVSTNFTNIATKIGTKMGDAWGAVKTGVTNMYTTFTDWIDDLWDNVFGKLFGWLDKGIDKIEEFFGTDSTTEGKGRDEEVKETVYRHHATGGIFNKEHLAHFAEGNKAEAIIPLENASAMQPFVDAVANGITAGLLPTLLSVGNNNNGSELQPLYVGTLVADERGLKELERRMKVVRLAEEKRG